MSINVLKAVFSPFGKRAASFSGDDAESFFVKRLEKGSFEQPRLNPSTGYHELSWETFSLIMSGVSLESVRFRKRYRTRFAGM